MGAATDIATEAAGSLIDRGILGALVVLLMLALIGAAVFHILEVRRIDKKHDEELAAQDAVIATKDKVILETQEAWRNDLKSYIASVAHTIDTIKDISSGRRRSS